MPSRELDKLIVDHLADIDAAAMALSALEAEVFSAIDGAASAWANERAWIGEFSYLDHGLWLAPQKWCLPGSKPANDSLLGYFQLEVGAGDTENSQRGEDYFYLTRLCRVGKGEIGFNFDRILSGKDNGKNDLKKPSFKSLALVSILSHRSFCRFI